jgi:hypothetical protein
MRTIRKSARCIMLALTILVSASAFAGPRGDDSPDHGIVSRITTIIVKALDDIRAGFPGG